MKGREAVLLAVIGVCVMAVLIGGCGGSSSTNASATDESGSTVSEQPSGPLTKAEFIKQADQICRAGVEKKEKAVLSLAKLATEAGGPPSSQAVEKVAKVVIFPTYSEVLDQVGELEPPTGEEAKVKKVLDTFEADLEAAEADPIKATKENMFSEANDAGEAYGFESCHF